MARKTIKERNSELRPLGKQLKHYGLVLRIYPTQEQIDLICRTFGCTRLVYNNYLADRKAYFGGTGKTYSVGAFKKAILNPSKDLDEYAFLSEVDKFALEVACENVEDTYDRFFKKQNKYPKFKTKRKAKKAYTTKFTKTSAGGNIRILNKKAIQLPKLGSVKMAELKCKDNKSKLAKLMNSDVRIMNATISQKGGKFYISLCLEEIVDIVKPLKRSEIDLDKVLGIDLGLKVFATMFDGERTEFEIQSNYIKLAEKKLAKLQRRLSKKKLDSKNFIKAAKKIAKLQEHIANQRKDFNHKLSTKVANENQVVILETLNIKGMVRNKKLAKAISNTGWYQFITFLKYKLEWQGKIFLQIDKWFASSKLCSKCGEKKLALALSEREWQCASCGEIHERDENAAKNIRKEGLRQLNMVV